MCIYTYIHMFIHTSVIVHVWIYWSTYIHKYSGMCIHIFITIYICNDTCIQIHIYKQYVFLWWRIATFWGRAQQMGSSCSTVQKSRHRVPMLRTSLEPAFPCPQVWCLLQTRLWNHPNGGWVCRRRWAFGALLHLALSTEPIGKFHPTGSLSEASAGRGYRKPHAPGFTHHTHSTHCGQQHRLQHISFPQSIFWLHQRKNEYASEIKLLPEYWSRTISPLIAFQYPLTNVQCFSIYVED